MSLSSLQVLADRRNDILLAEVGAWLHDWRKCSDEHLKLMSGWKIQGLSKNNLANHAPTLTLSQIALPSLNCQMSIFHLMEEGRRGRENELNVAECILYLRRCHHAAHLEKEKDDNDTEGQQDYNQGVLLSSPFGYENTAVVQLTSRLWNLNWSLLADPGRHAQASEHLSGTFSQALGDTRRSINEVTLWDWSHIVAALYKAALAGALLGYQPNPNDLRWRLLSVRVDNATFIENVARIPDLLARQSLLRDGFERVRRLLEETYPLATRVYQDQDSSIYIVPNVANLLDATDAQGQTLSALIRAEFEKGTVKEEKLALKGEVIPTVQLDTQEWQAQRPDRTFEVPPIAKLLKEGVSTCADHHQVTDWWRDQKDTALCPVCRLRPMCEKAEACEHCIKRRGSRIEAWLKNPGTTIWMDEIADANDRVALIVGKFGLDDWLSGDLVQTLLVRCDPQNQDPKLRFVPKNPSPARLHRIWETCQRFWTETVNSILQQHKYGDALRCTRVAVVPDRAGRREGVPYDGVINGKAVSLLWLKDEQRFITISNLQLGVGQAKDETGLVREWHGQKCVVGDPDKPGKTFEFTVQQVSMLQDDKRTYAPYLTLVESPDQFLALVPADDALEILKQIQATYGEHFGKVQNRLPLFLGLVFFQRKTPLMAAMDTARRMLGVRMANSEWQIAQASSGRQNVTLELEQMGQRIQYRVPVVMGDGSEDKWYPYFFVEHFAEGMPDNRKHRFQHNGRWLVHVKDLKPGDMVSITSSRFAYLFLESTAARFQFDPERGAMLLDELPRLKEMWQAICKTPDMTDTRLQAISALFENKRQAWGLEEPITDEPFRQLVETTLIRDKVQGVSVEDVLNGRFRRCVDLHWHILKRRVSDEQRKEKRK